VKPSSLVALSLALPLLACGPKLVRETIYTSENESVTVQLRRTMDGDTPVPRGYQQPIVISDVRLAHILAQLQFQDKKGSKALIRSQNVYDLAEGLRAALAQAGPDDETVATVYMRDKNLGVFTADKVTAFRVAAEDDWLVFEFFVVEGRLDSQSTSNDGRYAVPTRLPDSRLPVDLLAGEAQTLAGSRGLRVDWRDDSFRRAVSFSSDGIRRRTILMEAEPEAEAPEPRAASGLSPESRDAQLDALDHLDEDRQAGLITEGEFQRRRRLILEGRLEEAGYSEEP
jgi:hypothetical protein